MAFDVEIMPSALAELKNIKVFHRRAIADAIDEQLQDQPNVPTRNRKVLPDVQTSFEFQQSQKVFIRAIREKPPHAATKDVL